MQFQAAFKSPLTCRSCPVLCVIIETPAQKYRSCRQTRYPASFRKSSALAFTLIHFICQFVLRRLQLKLGLEITYFLSFQSTEKYIQEDSFPYFKVISARKLFLHRAGAHGLNGPAFQFGLANTLRILHIAMNILAIFLLHYLSSVRLLLPQHYIATPLLSHSSKKSHQLSRDNLQTHCDTEMPKLSDPQIRTVARVFRHIKYFLQAVMSDINTLPEQGQPTQTHKQQNGGRKC